MNNWIWMPHPAHFICGRSCHFRLATYVPSGYIISTVGEYFPEESVREILAKSRGVELRGMGDERRADYMKKLGYEEIGCDRLYETMVFRAQKNDKADQQCCPYVVSDFSELDFNGYNDAGRALSGHMELCQKWADSPLS